MANTDGFKAPGYQTERMIGAGGMSEVYLVRDNLDRLFALKALSQSLQQDSGFRQRFRSEARIMASLTHPNIVQLHSYIEDEPRYCLVMEFMSGGSLKDMLRSTGPIIESRALAYLKQIASGMAYAHAKGIIHRDIKPANILVGADGSMKITDFGIARISDSEGYTKTGARMGTVVYMSPEQIADSKHVSPASDVFSLGVTFWEMLTGKVPYDESTESEFKILEKIVYQDLPDPREVYPHISDHTISILRGMTQRDVNKRLSIDQVLALLDGKETVVETVRETYVKPTEEKPQVLHHDYDHPVPTNHLSGIYGVVLIALVLLSIILGHDSTLYIVPQFIMLILYFILYVSAGVCREQQSKLKIYKGLNILIFALILNFVISSLVFS